jgi:hypothetical protein
VKSSGSEPVNLLELKPRRNVEWEIEEGGSAVLLVPKFRGGLLRAWLLPLLAKPNFRVRLDALGTAFWQHCDGSTPVLEIAEQMSAQSGSDVDDVLERLGRFLARLEREDFIVMNAQEGDRRAGTR